MAAGYFNVVVVTTASNGCCDMDKCYGTALPAIRAYVQQWPRTVVATVDGNDDVQRLFAGCRHCTPPQPPLTAGCHTSFADQLPVVDVHFVREGREQDFTRERSVEEWRRRAQATASGAGDAGVRAQDRTSRGTGTRTVLRR